MAIYNGNNDYLMVDGLDCSSFRRKIDIDHTIGTTDVTAGSGVEWTENAEALRSMTMSIFFGYPTDPVLRQQLLEVTRPGTHYVIYGPEGSGVGKPKHGGNMIFTGAPTTSNHDKSEGRGFTVAAINAGEPEFDMHRDTF